MKRNLLLLATLLSLAGAVYYTSTPAAAQNAGLPPSVLIHEPHPAIRGAIRALEKARVELQHANHDFGGHRVSAIQQCDAAIAELRLALKYDNN